MRLFLVGSVGHFGSCWLSAPPGWMRTAGSTGRRRLLGWLGGSGVDDGVLGDGLALGSGGGGDGVGRRGGELRCRRVEVGVEGDRLEGDHLEGSDRGVGGFPAGQAAYLVIVHAGVAFGHAADDDALCFVEYGVFGRRGDGEPRVDLGEPRVMGDAGISGVGDGLLYLCPFGGPRAPRAVTVEALLMLAPRVWWASESVQYMRAWSFSK